MFKCVNQLGVVGLETVALLLSAPRTTTVQVGNGPAKSLGTQHSPRAPVGAPS